MVKLTLFVALFALLANCEAEYGAEQMKAWCMNPVMSPEEEKMIKCNSDSKDKKAVEAANECAAASGLTVPTTPKDIKAMVCTKDEAMKEKLQTATKCAFTKATEKGVDMAAEGERIKKLCGSP